MTWKIVSDSGCDFRELKDLALDTNFENVPLTIQVGQEIFIDNAELNIDLMMENVCHINCFQICLPKSR